MNCCSSWILYGRYQDGKHFSDEDVGSLLDKLNEAAYTYYSSGAYDRYLCTFTTVYWSSYEEVINIVKELSRAIPDAVFCLEYHNTDQDVEYGAYQRIYFKNGLCEKVVGHVVYDAPKTIPYYDVP